jgi:hypothetical protein
MRELFIGLALALPVTLSGPALAAGAAHGRYLSDVVANAGLVEVKGGRGGGGGWGRGGGNRGFAATRGKKIGWRSRGCPPGLWRQGRC